MSQRRCAQLAAWGSAWLQGTVAFDDVLDAVRSPTGARHAAGPGFGPETVHPVSEALTGWKRTGVQVLRLALPVPGDVRGLSGPPAFRDVALLAGEAVYGVGCATRGSETVAGFGVTAVTGRPTPSSAGPEFVWYRGEVRDERPDPLSIPDAEYELTEAIRETASELARRGSTSWDAGVTTALSDARRAGERLNLPPAHPPRAVRLIAQAERLSAVLGVVDRDDMGELTVTGMTQRAQTLAPLRLAVRRALLAGYNAALSDTADSDAAWS